MDERGALLPRGPVQDGGGGSYPPPVLCREREPLLSEQPPHRFSARVRDADDNFEGRTLMPTAHDSGQRLRRDTGLPRNRAVLPAAALDRIAETFAPRHPRLFPFRNSRSRESTSFAAFTNSSAITARGCADATGKISARVPERASPSRPASPTPTETGGAGSPGKRAEQRDAVKHRAIGRQATGPKGSRRERAELVDSGNRTCCLLEARERTGTATRAMSWLPFLKVLVTSTAESLQELRTPSRLAQPTAVTTGTSN